MSKFLKYLLVVLLLLVTLRTSGDLDLGWHLRYGEYFFQTGEILKDNVISYVWPDYKWVEASWGYDLILYQIFTHFGFFGISVSGYVISLLTFILIINPIKRSGFFQLFFLGTLFISQTIPLYSSSMRAQSLSAFFFVYLSMFFYRYFRDEQLPKYLSPLFLPLFFLFWSNLHGSFILGLLLLLIYWLCWGLILVHIHIKNPSIAKFQPKRWVLLGISILISLITPLINPWGFRLYLESFKHSSNVNLTGISEWMPIGFFTLAGILGIITILLVLFLALRKRQIADIPYIIIFLILSYLSFSAVRFLIYFGIMATFYVAKNINVLSINKLFHANISSKLNIMFKVILVTLVLLEAIFINEYFRFPNKDIINFNWNDYCKIIYAENIQAKDCSEDITAEMIKNPPQGNGYHPYNYGGYLSWRVPEIKTFIDGRMVSWEENGQTPPLAEQDWVISEKSPIAFRKLDSRYHFQWIIIPTFTPVTKYLNELAKSGAWEKRFYDVFYSYFVKRN